MSEPIVIRTKSELEKAIDAGTEHFIVKGELAEKLERSRTIKKLSKPMLVALGAAIVATPFTGGVSGAVGFAAVATLTGIEVVAIVAVAFLGISLVLNICENFEMKFKCKKGDCEAEMYMKKNK